MSGIARIRNTGSHFQLNLYFVDGDLNFVRNSGMSARRELTVFRTQNDVYISTYTECNAWHHLFEHRRLTDFNKLRLNFSRFAIRERASGNLMTQYFLCSLATIMALNEFPVIAITLRLFSCHNRLPQQQYNLLKHS